MCLSALFARVLSRLFVVLEFQFEFFAFRSSPIIFVYLVMNIMSRFCYVRVWLRSCRALSALIFGLPAIVMFTAVFSKVFYGSWFICAILCFNIDMPPLFRLVYRCARSFALEFWYCLIVKITFRSTVHLFTLFQFAIFSDCSKNLVSAICSSWRFFTFVSMLIICCIASSIRAFKACTCSS